jgi:uncharacterized protein (DUF433 family)
VKLERGSVGDRGIPDNGARPTVTIPLSRIAREVDDKVREMEARTADEIGHITRNRRIMHGLPVLAGTRIPTSTIYYFVRNGYDRAWILDNYPRLKDEDIEAAIAFEERALESRAAS